MIHLRTAGAGYSFATGGIRLPDIDLKFDNLLVVKGRIGSGKTMLLKTLAGIISPSRGVVSLKSGGKDVQAFFVHSQPEFNFVTGTFKDELAFSGIAAAGFEKYLGINVNNVSGGELKKLSIILAASHHKDIILLDEPLDMLDDRQSEVIKDLILEKSNKIPFIISTHGDDFDSSAPTLRIDEDYSPDEFKFIKSSEPGDILLELHKLSVKTDSYLPELTFNVRQNEIVCLYGENGCGKTLSLRVLAGISRRPYTGGFKFYSKPGFCLQFPEHMAYRGTVAGEIQDMAGDSYRMVLKELGWESRGELSPFALSDGERRVMYIMAVLYSKKCCIFDEPFAGLDGRSAAMIKREFVKARDRGCAVLYTANRRHDSFCSDKVIEFER